MRKNRAGSLLLEVLLSIALISVLAGVSAPVYQSFEARNNLDVSASTIVQTLRRAGTLARAVDSDISWGVKVQPGSIVLFQGLNFSSRNQSFDEIFNVSPSISYSGPSEIVFSKFSGLPQATGTITLTSQTSETRAININGKGLVSY